MSLINQVLKDLDKRSSSSETGKLLSGEVRNAQMPKRGVKALIPAILLLAVAGGGGYFAWKKYYQPSVPAVNVVQAPPQPAPVIVPPAPPVPPPAPLPPAEAVAVPATPAQAAGTETTSPAAVPAGQPSPAVEMPQPPAVVGGVPASTETVLSASAAGVLLSLDFPNPIKYKVFSLSGPNRVVVDLEGVGLTPALEQLPKKLTSADSEIADIRVGRFTPTVTRIVLGLKGALPDVKSSVQPVGNGGQRLMVQWGQPVPASASTEKSPPAHFLGMEKELKPQHPSPIAKVDEGTANDKHMTRKGDSAHLRSSRTLSSGQDSSSATEYAATIGTGKKQQDKSATQAVRGGAAEPLKVMSGQQRSDNLYRQAVAMVQQGRIVEAKTALRESLTENPNNHTTRQLLAGMLVEESQQREAIGLLNEGLKRAPEHVGFRMALARLQVDASDRGGALATLQEGLQYAGEDAEYNGFLAALLQREDRHEEAIEYYLVALKTNPAMPSWLVGIGISLQAQGKLADANEAFNRAKHTGGLSPELAQFVEQRLGQIKQQLH